MARYNCAFSIEKDGRTRKKFEVVETESKNKDYVLAVITKKYPKHSIHIKYIRESINGKANAL